MFRNKACNLQAKTGSNSTQEAHALNIKAHPSVPEALNKETCVEEPFIDACPKFVSAALPENDYGSFKCNKAHGARLDAQFRRVVRKTESHILVEGRSDPLGEHVEDLHVDLAAAFQVLTLLLSIPKECAARARRAALAVLLPWLPTAEELKRLTIVNGCNTEPIWIAHLANTGVGPGAQNSKIEPGASFSFGPDVTDGLEGARYWPKMGCDENGDHCSLGGSGGPSQACVINGDDYSNCAPPVDTKFEATWGREGEPCDASNPATMAGCDSVDVSLVDGWTLPFKLEVKSGVCTAAGEKTVSQIDCSGLTLDQCPANEDFGGGNGAVSMQAVNPGSGQQAGCYGPCLKLIDDKWGNAFATGRSREDPDVVPYCCTTPPMDSETCNAGPIKDSKYLDTVHRLCPGVYGFAYDDGMGLLRCTYGEYVVTFFCPGAGSVHAAPAQPPRPPAGAGGAAAAAPPAAGVPPGQGNCKDAIPGEPCFKAVRWAIEHGFAEHPEWYPRLSASSPEAAFQAHLAELGEGGCARPCAEAAGGPDPGSVGAAVPPASEAAAPPAAAADGAIRRFTPRGALHNAGVREGSGPGAPAALAVAVAAVASSLLALRWRGHRTGTLLEPDQGAYALTAQDL